MANLNPKPVPAGVRLKASTLRSYVKILHRDHNYDAVAARVPAETAAIIADPPLATSWVDFKHVMHITMAIESIGGMSAVRDFAKKAIDDAKGPHLKMLEGLIRMFGMSPALVFKRMNDMVKTTIENNVFHYEPTSDKSGVMEVRWLVDYEIPTCMFYGVSMTFKAIFDAFGAKSGIVGNPERMGPAAARYLLQW